MSRGRRERRRRRVLLGTLVGTSVSTLVGTLVGVHARNLVRGLGGFRGGFARRANRLPRASNLPPASLAVEHELRAGRGGRRTRAVVTSREDAATCPSAHVFPRARGGARGWRESRECAMAPPTGRYTPPPVAVARALCPPWTSPGSSTGEALRRTLRGTTGSSGSRWPGPVKRFWHDAAPTAGSTRGMPLWPWSAPVGSARTGATSAAPPANQLERAQRLPPALGGVAGAAGRVDARLDGRADAPAPATDVVGVAARVMLMLAGRLKRDALRGTGEERRERGAVHSRGIHRVRLALGGRGHREESDARGDMRARTNARPRCRRLSVGVSTRERRGRSRASEASADRQIVARAARVKRIVLGLRRGRERLTRASHVRRSSGGNLTTRDRALRVPYPSRLFLACASGDATQRLAAPGGSRWTRRERLDVPSSARSGCFGSRSLGSRLCDARAGFLPHTPPTLTQPRMTHPDGSVPFPLYRLES